MKISTDSIEVEIFPDEMRHFKINSATDLKKFLHQLRIEKKEVIGFKVEK